MIAAIFKTKKRQLLLRPVGLAFIMYSTSELLNSMASEVGRVNYLSEICFI